MAVTGNAVEIVISSLIDGHLFQRWKDNNPAGHMRTHINLVGNYGAGAWLISPPGFRGKRVDPGLYKIMLKRRLRSQLFDEQFCCPSCHLGMDQYGDHALTCSGGGHRSVRHNKLNKVLHGAAMEGNLRPAKEKGGLFYRRPLTGKPLGENAGWFKELEAGEVDEGIGDQDAENFSKEEKLGEGDRRRPADTYLPHGPGGKAAAVDWAVTSGLQSDTIVKGETNAQYAMKWYESYKREYRPRDMVKSTATLCRENGLDFYPLVIEQHGGGWGGAMKEVIAFISTGISDKWNTEIHVESKKFAQQISTTLHMENARAIWGRYPGS